MKQFSREECNKRVAMMTASLIKKLAGDDNYVINLGIGFPTAVSDYLDSDNIFLQSENGILGFGPIATDENRDEDIVNAGLEYVTEKPGVSYFSLSDSFGMIRGGHINAVVLGAFEVDSHANIANWTIPGQYGVGGAMDLVCGAGCVIVNTAHQSKNGPKLVKDCSLPLTGLGCVDYVVTEYAMFHFVDGRWKLEMIAADTDPNEVRPITGFDYDVADELAQFEF